MANRVGLALSGGGFRATLFHLGVIDAMRKKQQLSCVTDVSGVSGGSITAAHLVANWKKYNGTDEEFEEVKQELKKLTQRDVRGRVLNRVARSKAYRGLTLVPLFWDPPTTAQFLEDEYKTLLGTRTFKGLPDAPKLSVLSASLTTGQIVAFTSDGIFFWPKRRPHEYSNVKDTTLARAVAASAAFPILSSPVDLTADYLGIAGHEGGIDHLLTDGGIFDNLGAYWLAVSQRDLSEDGLTPLDRLFVSDAGKPYDWSNDGGLFARNMRANSLAAWRLAEYDLEVIKTCVADFHVVRIDHRYSHRPPLGAPNQREVKRAWKTRTDLNEFEDEEFKLLVKHGKYATLEVLDGIDLCQQNPADSHRERVGV